MKQEKFSFGQLGSEPIAIGSTQPIPLFHAQPSGYPLYLCMTTLVTMQSRSTGKKYRMPLIPIDIGTPLQLLLISIIFFQSSIFSQSNKQWSSSEIYHHLTKLRVMGTVLYVAAHPDDENTRLITWLAQEKKVNTAYVSLTRGEGGQNLIGDELDGDLGIIRTYELTKAREIDGGMQFFSRAADFGYSKTPTETFQIWNKDEVLGDLVYVIRKIQPDVIITRFNPGGGKTHGHHTASAILANEAYTVAADPSKYVEQLVDFSIWKYVRAYWNTSSFFFDKDFNKDTLANIDVGVYNSYLGKSYTEIAALSRSCHKSQGFGTIGSRGENLDYFIHTNGSYASSKNLFQDIDMTWNRVNGGKEVDKIIQKIIQSYDFKNPSKSVIPLVRLYQKMSLLDSKSYLIQRKKQDVIELVKQCLGLYYEINTEDYIYAVGDTLRFKYEVINRSGALPIQLVFSIPNFEKYYESEPSKVFKLYQSENVKTTSSLMKIKLDAPISNPPWWNVGNLLNDKDKYIESIENIHFSNNEYQVKMILSDFLKVTMHSNGYIKYKKQDPAKGEITQPVYFAPPITITSNDKLLIFPTDHKKKVDFQVQAFKPNVKGVIKFDVPKGWSIEPKEINLSFTQKRETQTISVDITPSSSEVSSEIKYEVIVDGKSYHYSFNEIKYDHIPIICTFPESKTPIIRFQTNHHTSSIAYIDGAGDDVSEILKQLNYQVDMISPQNYFITDFSKYKAVILGIRSYNTIQQIHSLQNTLYEYVKNGGNLIVQYVTTQDSKAKQNGPFEFKISRDRVTDENAVMTILDSTHMVFNYPYRLRENDFIHWKQERGIYFASDFGVNYQSLLSVSDKDENLKSSPLIYTKYGKGNFVYTGLSLFRQLPFGVTNSYKLMINLIEMK